MSNKRDIHVTHRANGDWAVIKEKSARAGSLHDTQKDAIAAGRAQAQRENVELVIHGRDNQIRNPNSYGNDPNPPRDTK